jgi:ribosomal protein L6P/L9E
MIHGKNKEEVEGVAAAIAERTGIEDYVILYSTKEYKKERVKYFV